MSRRDQIRMSDDEAGAFLEEQRTVTCATLGPRGWPHLMPLWYLLRDGEIWCWTYTKSQKVKNLERDPRATLQVEAGDSYEKLRGVMLECDTVIHRDTPDVQAFGEALFERYARQSGHRDGGRAGAQARGAAVRRAPPGDLGPPQAGRGLLVKAVG